MPGFTFLDFFCGAGLVTEALRPWFAHAWANDICPKKGKVYTLNHGSSELYIKPVQEVSGNDVPSAPLSWASFPCQDLSLAGNIKGIDSDRSGLVWHWLRILDEMPERPPILAIENVTGLISTNRGEDYKKLHTAIFAKGYSVGPLVVDASSWLPQSRPRIFIVAVDRRMDFSKFIASTPNWAHTKRLVEVATDLPGLVWWKLPLPYPKKKTLSDIIDFSIPCDPPEKTAYNLSLIPENHWKNLKDKINSLKAIPGYKRVRSGKQVLELRFDGVAGCLRTPRGGSSRQIIVQKSNGTYKTRLLAVREAARLMGADDSYKLPVSYNDGYRAMGDAVAIPVVRHIAEHLLFPLAECSHG